MPMFPNFFPGRDAYEIVPMRSDDAAIAAGLHSGAFARAWSDDEFVSLITQPAVYGFLALDPARPRNQAAGFVLAREAAGEAEILSICVAARARGSGLGWRLMQEAIARDAGEMFLEVDETNAPALALYRKLGFDKVGERRAYYDHADAPRTAAFVMRRQLADARP